MYFMYRHLNEGSFQPVYADTDRETVQNVNFFVKRFLLTLS